MWIINIIIILLILIGILLCYKNKQEWIRNIDKKEHNFYLIYPLAEWLIVRLRLEQVLNKFYNVAESMQSLYINSKPEFLQKLLWCRKLSQMIGVLLIINILSLFSYLTEINNSPLIDGRYLVRPDYGEGSTEVDLSVTLKQDNEAGDKEDTKVSEPQDVSIRVGERIYTQEELEQLFIKSMEYLQKDVLSNNESFDTISENLNFCSVIPGTSISVVWFPEDYSMIQSDGTVHNEGIDAAGINTSVTAVLTYYEYKKEQSFTFRILPKQYNEKEILNTKLVEEVKAYSDKSETNELLELPESLEGYSIQWYAKKSNSSGILIFLGVFLMILIWIWGDKDLEKQMKRRKDQMLLDYPELINKFTLLVNAGMTIKQAWSKIAEDYDMKRSQPGFTKRYAYEEMLTTVHELKLGIAENTAYEQYGRRTGLIPYIKFSSLLSQNLKKGTKGFTELLMHEALEAFENRKEAAKRLGEEAGTKLLFPMMVLLIIVFLIIMIPAFMAFQI